MGEAHVCKFLPVVEPVIASDTGRVPSAGIPCRPLTPGRRSCADGDRFHLHEVLRTVQPGFPRKVTTYAALRGPGKSDV